MTSENSFNRPSWRTAYGQHPRKGSRVLPQLLDFTLESPVNINLTFDQQSERLEFVQAMYIDNSLNTAALIMLLYPSGQSISIPPGWQAYLPVLASSDNFRAKFITTGTPIIPVQFLSFPLPAQMWPASGVITPSQPGSIGTDYSSAAAVAAVAAVIAGSTLLATVPVNANRNQLIVQNQSTDTIQLIQDDGAGNSPTLTILNPAFAVGSQGGSWTDNYFKGRLLVYSTGAASQISVRQE